MTTTTTTTSTGTTSSGTTTRGSTGGHGPVPTLASITFDCADALVVARFWAEVLHRPVPDDATADYVQLAGEPAWSFVTVPEPKAAKNRVHVDLDVEDLGGEVDRLIGSGATRLGEFDEEGYRWVTLADPEGNEFDVVAASTADGTENPSG